MDTVLCTPTHMVNILPCFCPEFWDFYPGTQMMAFGFFVPLLPSFLWGWLRVSKLLLDGPTESKSSDFLPNTQIQQLPTSS